MSPDRDRCFVVSPCVLALFLAAWSTLACTPPQAAASLGSALQPPTNAAPRVEVPVLDVLQLHETDIRIDGVLDDVGWARATSTEFFVAPGDGSYVAASPVNARARAAWSEQSLFLAVEVADADPSSPFGETDLDPHIWSQASGIELMLQPGDAGNNEHYYEVQIDVNGAVWDTHFEDYNRPIVGEGDTRTYGHASWSSGVERRVLIDAASGSYTVEFRIPWASFSHPQVPIPPRAGDVWRANLYSFRDAQRHSLAWSAILGGGNFHYAPRFGRLRFVTGRE